MTGKGHPLPASDEARHGEIPEDLERDKGLGDDAASLNQPSVPATAPDGEPYRYADLGRGPGTASKESDMDKTREHDPRDGAPAETPRDQQQSGVSAGGRQLGGGPGPSDMAAPGGSSGSGGYGNAQDGQSGDNDWPGGRENRHLSRGERFDERQGGGRGPDSVSDGPESDEERIPHQDRGQAIAEAERDEE